MPVLNMYALRDRAADCFLSPFVGSNDDIAIRDVVISLYKKYLDDDSFFVSDLSLFLVGTYDTSSGVVESYKPEPKLLITGDSIYSHVLRFIEVSKESVNE